VLDARALNRATLARQMLLARERATALAALERLVGLQAQLARPPFVGLWSRLSGFTADELLKLARARKVARGTLMRGTLHLVTAKDFGRLRPVLQPMLDAGRASVLGARADSVDAETLRATARAFLDEQPRTFDALRAELRLRFPKADERALAYTVRMQLPLVQLPDDESRWGWPGAAAVATAEAWLKQRPGPGMDARALVLRYLAGFGPASFRDAQTWSGLRGLESAFEALRPKLAVFRDARGRELFDLKTAPRPPADTAAPVRFLPDYDNLLLGHADRTRVVPDEHKPRLATANLRVMATYLVDGFVAGTWRLETKSQTARVVLDPFTTPTQKERAALVAEGTALARFMEPDAATVSVEGV
jgi:hypothetical protein